jgi:hypothetical protein
VQPLGIRRLFNRFDLPLRAAPALIEPQVTNICLFNELSSQETWSEARDSAPRASQAAAAILTLTAHAFHLRPASRQKAAFSQAARQEDLLGATR